jgi:hypothetical protein
MRLGVGASSSFTPGIRRAAAEGMKITVGPYAEGAAGAGQSVDVICQKIRDGQHDPDLQGWAADALREAGFDGRTRKPSVQQLCQALVAKYRAEVIYASDPARTEQVQSASATLCLRGKQGLCLRRGDCDDGTVAMGAAILSFAIPVKVVVQPFPEQAHVLIAAQDERGEWLGVDTANNPYNVGPFGAPGCPPFVAGQTDYDPLSLASVGAVNTVQGAQIVTMGKASATTAYRDWKASQPVGAGQGPEAIPPACSGTWVEDTQGAVAAWPGRSQTWTLPVSAGGSNVWFIADGVLWYGFTPYGEPPPYHGFFLQVGYRCIPSSTTAVPSSSSSPRKVTRTGTGTIWDAPQAAYPGASDVIQHAPRVWLRRGAGASARGVEVNYGAGWHNVAGLGQASQADVTALQASVGASFTALSTSVPACVSSGGLSQDDGVSFSATLAAWQAYAASSPTPDTYNQLRAFDNTQQTWALKVKIACGDSSTPSATGLSGAKVGFGDMDDLASLKRRLLTAWGQLHDDVFSCPLCKDDRSVCAGPNGQAATGLTAGQIYDFKADYANFQSWYNAPLPLVFTGVEMAEGHEHEAKYNQWRRIVSQYCPVQSPPLQPLPSDDPRSPDYVAPWARGAQALVKAADKAADTSKAIWIGVAVTASAVAVIYGLSLAAPYIRSGGEAVKKTAAAARSKRR